MATTGETTKERTFKIASTVRLFGLKAAQYNDKVGKVKSAIQNGRMTIEIDGGVALKIKTENILRICCNCLQSEGEECDLHVCSRCTVASYCGRDCQKSHYKKVSSY